MLRTTVLALFALVSMACGNRAIETEPCADTVDAGAAVTCDMPGYDDRAYDLVVPDTYAGQALPLVVVFHGGGGNRAAALKTTCPGGKIDDPSCIHAMGTRRGYALVFPDGTEDNILPNSRTWNAGGGVDDFRCVSGDACEQGVDDVKYVRDLIAHVSERVAIDPRRIYATGLSNGGAISHRMACQNADIFAAIAPVGGGMQLTVSDECAPSRPVPVMHTHGTADTCWNYDGGAPTCGGGITGQPGKKHVPISRTMDEWAEINGCTGVAVESMLDDTVDDGTTTARFEYQGCDADLVHLRVDGGGHVWPNGHQYLGVDTVGPVWTDWGNEVLFDWFDDHSMPE